jgi:two-component system, chemotaxis family, response regulator Rcp1
MEPVQIPARVRDLLIVDDDPVQINLFRHFLEEVGCKHRCHAIANGTEALQFLRKRGPYRNAPRPELIVLDINMPGMNGCEVLTQIKRDPDLCSIPVIMFSAGVREEDLRRCYTAGANAYVQKPSDYEATLKVVEQIDRFWFHIAILPRAYLQA